MISTTDQSYLNQLNDTQRQAAVANDGPCLVVAGPGSGKTRVLTYRIAHLLQSGVKPWEILSLTFTNKAAREMKSRISKVVGSSANDVWAGTFHSIFAKILRIEAEKIGYPSNFTIYDTDDSKSLIRSIIKDMNLNKDHYAVNSVYSRISSAKSNLIPPALYLKDVDLMSQDRKQKRPYMGELYKQYMNRCKKAGAMDFDDLLYRFYELLHKNPDGVREKYQNKFKYVLVDEFQDTNHLQYEIVRKLVIYPNSSHNITVVGDDAQSIYAFRGATIQNILDFETDFKNKGIKVFKLEQNYRSTNHIVKAANEVISFNKKQIKKTIRSEKGEGAQIKVIRTVTDNEEGKRVVDIIQEQKNRSHLHNSDIAILYRTNSQSRIFEEYLRRAGINYKVFGGLSFYQRKEIKDLVGYFRLIVNPKDEEALRRVINYPRRAIGNSTMDKISDMAKSMDSSLWDAIPFAPLAGKARRSVDGFVDMINKLRKQLDVVDAYELATKVVHTVGIQDELKKDTSIEGLSRMENASALMDAIKEFVDSVDDTAEETADVSLTSYIQNISLLTDQDSSADSDNYVTLMSVHSAKGLEFPSVLVVGMEENLFPSFMSSDSADAVDEERRLFYVAITRAESFLTLSYASSRYKFGQMRYNEPSRFLSEIDKSHLDMEMSSFNSGSSMSKFSQSKPSAPSNSGVKGYFKKPATSQLKVDLSNFKASPPAAIMVGQKVLHQKFGAGKVLSIDGGRDKRVATIFFQDVENPQKRLMLNFAKLQILN